MACAQNMDLIEISGLKQAKGYFKPQELLSINQVDDSLSHVDNLNDAGNKMTSYIRKARGNEYFNLRIPLPITKVRHVTTREYMEGILQTKSFKGGNGPQEMVKDLSCWSAEVLPRDIEKAGIKEFWENLEVCKRNQEESIKSPAFNHSVSRYGNFVFSFELSTLIDEYRHQLCQGEDPQLSVVGTAMYRLEIVHIIVFHSPHTEMYKDFPKVPVLPSHAESLPFVYQREEDGQLCWRPESTSLKVISEDGYCSSNWRYCVWNHLVIAFHLPEGQRLVIPKAQLGQNLTACETDPNINLTDDYTMSKTTAEEIIKSAVN